MKLRDLLKIAGQSSRLRISVEEAEDGGVVTTSGFFTGSVEQAKRELGKREKGYKVIYASPQTVLSVIVRKEKQ